MKNKFFILFLTWFFVVIAYVIIGYVQPVLQTLSDATAATINSSSNMSNYPGTLESVQLMPLFMWFVPAIIGGVVTVVTLRSTGE